jgi:hypothetical protein
VGRLPAARAQPAVDRLDHACDEPRVGAGQEGDDVGDPGRLGAPPHRDAAQELRDVVGRDRQLDGQRPGQVDQGAVAVV